MARYREAVCRLCRREGVKLFLKGERCFTDKCAIERRNMPPGQHGTRRRRSKVGAYGVQLREKQKVRRIYGEFERQFRRTFARAEKLPGKTGENLLATLERRLDSIVQRAGFASSRAQARQLVLHGHVRVNGKRVNIPSYLLAVGEEVAVADRMKENAMVLQAGEHAARQTPPSWLEVERAQFRVKLINLPKREELTTPEINEQLIVEFYSK